MTSAFQMSSWKPPVAQSTFGFPDDFFLGARAFQPAANSAHPPLPSPSRPSPLPPGFGLRQSPAAFPPSPFLTFHLAKTVQLSSRSFLAQGRKNAEKLSFQARCTAVYRQPKKVNTSHFFNIVPNQNCPTVPLPSPPSALFRWLASLGFNSSFGFRPWSFRAAAPFLLSSCLCELRGRFWEDSSQQFTHSYTQVHTHT